MQWSVILGILLTILNSRKVTREQLAQKYEINVRTVSRYLDVLTGAGVPIESVSGRYGGLRVPNSYKLDRSFFSKDELKRLSTCVHAMQSNFFDGMNGLLLDKINNMAGNKDDEKYLLKSDTLIIDIGTWTNPQIYRNKIETVNKAISNELCLNIEYIDRNEYRSERLFDPYSLILKEGVWYVYGLCHLRRDFRLFKLSRIKNISISSTHFVRKESNVYAKLQEDFDNLNLVDVEIEFSSTVLAEIEEWLGTDSIIDDGGLYRVKAALYGGNVLISKLLSFGSSIKVLSPNALKEELMIECKRIVKNY